MIYRGHDILAELKKGDDLVTFDQGYSVNGEYGKFPSPEMEELVEHLAQEIVDLSRIEFRENKQ